MEERPLEEPPPEPPRRRTWRRRVASLVLLVGAILLGNYLFGAHDKVASVEIHYRMGDPPVAESLAVDVKRRGRPEVIAVFRRDGVASETVHHTKLAPGMYDLDITLSGGGRSRTVTRAIEARADAVVTVDLSGEKL